MPSWLQHGIPRGSAKLYPRMLNHPILRVNHFEATVSRQDAQVVKEGALLQAHADLLFFWARMYCSVYNYCGSKANRSLENNQISLVPHNFHKSSVSIQIKFCKVLDCLDPLTNPVGADHKECPGYSNELRCCQVCLVARDLASNLSCTSGCNCDLWRPGWSRVAEIFQQKGFCQCKYFRRLSREL